MTPNTPESSTHTHTPPLINWSSHSFVLIWSVSWRRAQEAAPVAAHAAQLKGFGGPPLAAPAAAQRVTGILMRAFPEEGRGRCGFCSLVFHSAAARWRAWRRLTGQIKHDSTSHFMYLIFSNTRRVDDRKLLLSTFSCRSIYATNYTNEATVQYI